MTLTKQISSYLKKCSTKKASRLMRGSQQGQDGSLQSWPDPTRIAGYWAASSSPWKSMMWWSNKIHPKERFCGGLWALRKCLLRLLLGESRSALWWAPKRFQMAYSNLLRTNVARLKRRDTESKSKKSRAIQWEAQNFLLSFYFWLQSQIPGSPTVTVFVWD